ncbi:MAG: hypothetical protein KHZ29_09955 [Desulfovibrionaceae bacterium]|nr:hypothetical protein [Desulfovibrionaceae bacterium]
MKFIILQATYYCSPLYDSVRHEYIDLSHLPISLPLKDELKLWAEKFNQLVDFENPTEGYIASSLERKEFIYTGYNLQNKLMKELGYDYSINYLPIFSNRTLQLWDNYEGSPFLDKEPPYFIEVKQMPITDHLKYEINQWRDFYKKIVDYENPKNGFLRNSWERKNFIIQGYELKNKLIKELSPHSFAIDYMPIPEVRTLRFMADYDSLPLRDRGYPFSIDLNDLPISKDLIRRLEDWDDAYVATLNQEDPPHSDFPTPEERKKFIEEGYTLQRLLQEALKDNFIIEYKPLPEKAGM